LHNTTTTIRGYSNVPGLQCFLRKHRGYPKTSRAITPESQYLGERPKNETVCLKVHDETGWETNIKMVNTVQFRYLMKTYASQSKRDLESVKFFFDGEPLLKTETPKKVSWVRLRRI
jgi:hypothetical protein